MRRSLACVLVAVSISVAGCFGTLKVPPENTNYGAPPVSAEPAIRIRMETILRDAESARYRIGGAERAYFNAGRLRGGEVVWKGHVVYFDVNAKNAYGGYTGFEPYMALFNPDGVGIFEVIPGRSHPLLYLAKDVE